MSLEPWQAVLLLFALVFEFFLIFRLWKQIRCLKYCYVEISDWGVDKLEDVRAHYIQKEGEERIYRPLNHYSESWNGKNDELNMMMRRVGLRPPNLTDLIYPLES